MGKKHDKKGKKKVVLSLAEFNDGASQAPVDPDLAVLPTAPKGAEEWEAQGGRPEYNSRGYKERTASAYKDRGYDDDFDERDWSRRGPLEEREKSSGFGTGAERDWSDMRRGPVEPEGGDAVQERNWNDMRRGPVDAAFDAGNVPERNWGVRKGPIEVELPGRVIGDEDWGNARRMAVEADLPQGKTPAQQDWSIRKPVEAETAEKPEEADWSAPRRGPVEAEIPQPDAEKDWTIRKGPIEAEATKTVPEANWSDVRRGLIEAETPNQRGEGVDWARRRGPIDEEVENTPKPVRAIDFGEMRRGAKLKELAVGQPGKAPNESGTPRVDLTAKEHWRRDIHNNAGRQGFQDALDQPSSSPVDSKSVDSKSTPKERDWSAARRAQPVKANPRYSRSSGNRNTGRFTDDESSRSPESNAPLDGDVEDDDDWTTVRSAAHRRSLNRRSVGRGSGHHRRSGPRQSEENLSMRPAILEGSKVANTSPVTPVTSSATDS